MSSHYVETETRFTQSGRQIDRVYDPQRMPLYSLAKTVYFNKSRKPEAYANALAERTSGVVDDVLGTLLLPSKPSFKELQIIRRDRNLIKQVWRISGTRLIQLALKDFNNYYRENRRNQYSDRVRDPTIESTNRHLFNRRLFGIARAYIEGGQAWEVLSDLQDTKDAVADPSKFGILEQLCEGPLAKFFTDWKVTGMDRESQRQEGLMVVWQCAPKYAGQNFARFRTMVRAALRNKAIDLSRSLSTHKRRAWKRTSLEGLGEEGSRLGKILDDNSFNYWTASSRLEEDEQVEIPEPRMPVSEFEVKHAVFEGSTDEVDDNNSPVGLERRVELVNQGEIYKRKGDKEKRLDYLQWLEDRAAKASELNPMEKDKRERRDIRVEIEREEKMYEGVPF